jgi:hypothetical protein
LLGENINWILVQKAPAWRARKISICSGEGTRVANSCGTSQSNRSETVEFWERGGGAAVVMKPELIAKRMVAQPDRIEALTGQI